MGKRKTIEPYYLAETPFVFDHICKELASYEGQKWSIPEDLTSLTALVGAAEVEKLTAITDSAEQNIYLHNMLSNTLKHTNSSIRLAAMEWVVYDWGRVRRRATDSHKSWPKDLGLYRDEVVENFIYDNYQIRVASWSKVLAFAVPSKYAIYDARVAMSLNAMLDEVNYFHRFYMPPASSPALEKVFDHVKDEARALSVDKFPKYIGYFEYMKLLNALVAKGIAKNVLEVEMKLFANAYRYARQYSDDYDLKIKFKGDKDLE